MGSYLLGIDIGTSASKTVLFHTRGGAVAVRECPYGVSYPQPGWAQQDPDDWWKAAISGIRGVLEESGVRAADIAGIGVDGQSWAMVAIDKNGDVLHPSPIWTDTRAGEECAQMMRAVGEETWFGCSGNAVTPGHTMPKVLWLKNHFPDVYARAEKVLQSNGYIVYRLTGSMTQDLSQGYGWNCFDMERGEWNAALCREAGIRPELLPQLYECSETAGRLTRQAAALTGLCEGTPVVAGGLDAACSTLGVGVIHAGETQEQGGQAGGMSICMDTCSPVRSLILSRHVAPRRWLLQGGTTGGGGALKWFREQLCPQMSFASMSEAAAEAPCAGEVVFLPYMAGERSPLWNPDARGVFFGLSFATTRGQMIRAVMEGVAFSLRHNLDTAEAAGVCVGTLRATGGSCNSPTWMQIKADATGRRIEVPQAQTAASWGAAILAGMGSGVFGSWEEAVGGIQVTRSYEPEAKRIGVYEEQYQKYLRLIETLDPLMHQESGETERSRK